MIPVAYAVALTAIAWTLWVRRGTWRTPWEAPTTAASLLLGCGILLIAPAVEVPIGGPPFIVATHWHVDDMLGHVCLLAALASSAVAGLSRIPSARAHARPLIEYPFTLAVALMVALLDESTTSRNPTHEMFLIPHDGWITAYWAVYILLLIYLLTLNAWAALTLRHDPRSRPVAHALLIGIAIGAGGIIGWALPWLNLTGWYDWGRLAVCAAATVYSLSTARSWRAKLAPYRGLIRVTRARP